MKFIEPLEHLIDPQFRNLVGTDLNSAGFFLFYEQNILMESGTIEALGFERLPSNISTEDLLYVGSVDSRPYYALAIEDNDLGLDVVSLRSLLDEAQDFFQLAGRAQQLVQWDRDHRFCGRCAAETTYGEEELVRECQQCGLRAYPRLSPCVIMLVHRGDKILLAQRPNTKTAWYTVQAGFIEVGESAEEAVVREVLEETGLSLSSLKYFGSQPWPFPGQLMFGYFAENLEGELKPDPAELENAAWFDYRDLPEYPGPNTISGKLIRQFVAERSAQAALPK